MQPFYDGVRMRAKIHPFFQQDSAAVEKSNDFFFVCTLKSIKPFSQPIYCCVFFGHFVVTSAPLDVRIN